MASTVRPGHWLGARVCCWWPTDLKAALQDLLDAEGQHAQKIVNVVLPKLFGEHDVARFFRVLVPDGQDDLASEFLERPAKAGARVGARGGGQGQGRGAGGGGGDGNAGCTQMDASAVGQAGPVPRQDSTYKVTCSSHLGFNVCPQTLVVKTSLSYSTVTYGSLRPVLSLPTPRRHANPACT